MAGVYIHIPFCKQKCSYCDFHFSTRFSDYRTDMIDTMCKEIVRRKDYLQKQTVGSIYFGGGTPSLLLENELSRLVKTVQQHFSISTRAEITLEANPDDITEVNLNTWKRAGVNRLSIGLQSFKKSDLQWMNRAHTVEESLQCIAVAQKFGFDLLTVDLMYGLPNLSKEEWENHIQQVLDFGVQHLSAYCLTREKNTLLDRQVRNGEILLPSEEEQSEQFHILLSTLEKNGYQQYEISNFCLPEFEAVHNSNYWKGKHYLGIGPSAHSFNGTSRQWNVANNHQYMQSVEKNTSYFETEVLTPQNQFNERILTGLRTKYGVNLQELEKIISVTEEFKQKVQRFIREKYMQEKKKKLILTKKGRLQADFIASELFCGEE